MLSTFGTRFPSSILRMSPRRDVGLAFVLLGGAVVLFIAYIARMHAITHDVFHEMALARVWLEGGTFPRDDVFAYTPTVSPAVHHEWGTGLLLYWAAAASPLGLYGLSGLKFSLVAALGVLLYRVARHNGSHPVLFVLLLPVVLPLMWVGFATLRAQLFTLVAVAAQMLMLQADWRGKRGWVGWWIPMYILWLNLHAGFVVGLGMLGFHLIERTVDARHRRCSVWKSVWHLVALGPIVALGLLCNPWGVDYPPYLWRAITMSRPTILEWKPLWYTYDPITSMIAFALSVGLMAYVAKARRWTRLRGWLFCALAAYMAFKHIRHGSLYGVIWLAWMPGWLTPTPLGQSLIAWVQHRREGSLRVARYVAIACSFFAAWNAFWQVSLPTTLAESTFCFPRDAVGYLKEHSVEGNLLTPFHCGAYLSWELHPRIKVSLDGRYEVAYAEEVMPAHQQFFEGEPGWESMLDRYDHDWILVPRNTPIFEKLINDSRCSLPDWRLCYQDDAYALIRRGDSDHPYVDRRSR